MHQTVREFFLNSEGPVAKSIFRMSETHAQNNLATTCIRYLSICVTNTSLVGKLPKAESWNTEHYKDYCRYLDRRPLASYALGHIKSHIAICTKDTNVQYAASQFIEHLTNSDAGASLLETWASPEFHQASLINSNTQITTTKTFRNEILRISCVYGFSIAAEVVLLAGADVVTSMGVVVRHSLWPPVAVMRLL